jgi:type IV pilus biogenesis/stability protein PilW
MMQKLWVLSLAFLLAGCVTTEVGDNPSPTADENEAAQINLQLGVSYFRQGNLMAAREKLEKAVQQKPNLAAGYRMLGLVYQEMGDFPEAETQYLKAVKLASNDPDTLNDYAGFLCFEKREVDKALTYFDKALLVPLNENRTMLYSNAARCAMLLYPQRAENYLRTALTTDRDNPVLMVQMADLAYRQQQYLQARVFLERSMELTPATPTMLYLLSKTEAQLGNIAMSRQYRAQLVELYPQSEEALAIQQGK